MRFSLPLKLPEGTGDETACLLPKCKWDCCRLGHQLNRRDRVESYKRQKSIEKTTARARLPQVKAK